ncbi:hypothetical protein CN613_25705 [Bacillus pseudomycoides]|uniref:Phage tail protein n=1 Tax=Bacillus pseudomycoides TaxID=64104 RepID=A0A2A8BYJ5_9BACI|nr:distal tail protein Dit [Bacillus pseudomycoides]PEM65341.1 hypothetical protein CN613_25705 [Bacillus pseudomycoides]
MITFAGKRIPDFVKVNKVGFNILPPVSNNLMKVQGRAGELDFGSQLGSRKISVDITLIVPKANEVMKYATILAEWLFYKELQSLIFDDEPDKMYYARIDGDTAIDEILSTGTGTLVFVCPSPFKESGVIKEVVIPKKPTASAHSVTITNNGSTDAYPEIELTFSKQVTTAVVATDDGQFFQLGEDQAPGQQSVESNKVILRDLLTTTAGWTTPVNVVGDVVVPIVSDGTRCHTQNWEYGDPDENNPWKFRGGGLMKSLSHSFYNFEFYGYFTFKCKESKEMGKVEFYLLDENNQRICRAGMWDDKADRNEPYFWAEVGGIQKVWKVPGIRSAWNDFEGYIRIVRTPSNIWSFYIAEYDFKVGKDRDAFYTQMYIGNNNPAYSLALSKVQFFIGACNTFPPTYDMSVNDIVVIESLPVAEDYVEILPFEPGDTATVNSDYGTVYRNGFEMYDFLNPYSDFIKLRKGVNQLAISPSTADVKIRYRERWL